MNDIEFCSVGCISTGREVFASTTRDAPLEMVLPSFLFATQ